MGASQDPSSEGLRRLLVNACYWALGMEDKIPAKTNVDLVGDNPMQFGTGHFTKGVKPRSTRPSSETSDRSPSLSRQAKRLQCVRDAQVGDNLPWK